jgi:hypothetical protein
MPRKVIPLFLIAIILVSGIVSCGSNKSVTIAPVSIPFEIKGEQVTVHSVSLVINEPGEFKESDLIKNTTQRLLAEIGIEVMASGSGEAKLTITQNGHNTKLPYKNEKTGWETTLNGAVDDVQIELNMPSHGTKTGHNESNWSPATRVSTGDKTSAEPWQVIEPALIGALTDIWGDYLPVAALKDTNGYIRIFATEELFILYSANKTMTPAPDSALALYDTWLNGKNYGGYQNQAYDALIALGGRAKGLIPNLVEKIIKDDKPGGYYIPTEEGAGKLLINIGQPSVSALLQLSGNQSDNIREYAVRALGEIDTNSPEIVQALIQSLKDKSGLVVEYAARSLLKKKPEIALPSLIEILNDKKEILTIRQNAAFAMTMVWQNTPDLVLPALLKIINDNQEKYEVRAQIITDLIYLPAAYSKVLPVVIDFMETDTLNSRYSAANILKIMGPSAMQAVPSLITALKNDPNEAGKSIFVSSLKAITGEDFGTNVDKWQQWWDKRK